MWQLLTKHVFDCLQPSLLWKAALHHHFKLFCLFLQIIIKWAAMKELHRRCCKQHSTEGTSYCQRETQGSANAAKFWVHLLPHRRECPDFWGPRVKMEPGEGKGFLLPGAGGQGGCVLTEHAAGSLCLSYPPRHPLGSPVTITHLLLTFLVTISHPLAPLTSTAHVRSRAEQVRWAAMEWPNTRNVLLPWLQRLPKLPLGFVLPSFKICNSHTANLETSVSKKSWLLLFLLYSSSP